MLIDKVDHHVHGDSGEDQPRDEAHGGSVEEVAPANLHFHFLPSIAHPAWDRPSGTYEPCWDDECEDGIPAVMRGSDDE